MRAWGLAEHAATMGVPLPAAAIEKLGRLLELLRKWNRVYNLTSIRDEEKWVSHHLLDSLSIVPIMPIGRMVDVGSGGGFPGLPVAIADPDRPVVVLDSNSKKTSFLRQAVAELDLANVVVETRRAEVYQPQPRFQVVVSRAFSDLKTFIQVCAHLCEPGGILLAMKGVYPREELDALSPGQVKQVMRLDVPTLGAERHVVLLHPSVRVGG